MDERINELRTNGDALRRKVRDELRDTLARHGIETIAATSGDFDLKTKRGTMLAVGIDWHSRLYKTRGVVIVVGGGNWGRHRHRGYSDRGGKGYEWKAIVADVREQDELIGRHIAQEAARNQYQARAQARLARLRDEFQLTAQPSRSVFGPAKGIELTDAGRGTIELNLNIDGLSEERARDVLARLASVGLLISG